MTHEPDRPRVAPGPDDPDLPPPYYAPGLTRRQLAFVEAYVILGDPKAAALKAGYSPRTAHVISSVVLHHPKVAAAIRHAQAARAERVRVTADRVLVELARLAFSDLGRVADWGPGGVSLKPKEELAPEDRAAIAELSARPGKAGVRSRVRLHDKNRALDRIARHLGLYDRSVLSNPKERLAEAERVRAMLRQRIEKLAREREAGRRKRDEPTASMPYVLRLRASPRALRPGGQHEDRLLDGIEKNPQPGLEGRTDSIQPELALERLLGELGSVRERGERRVRPGLAGDEAL